jgi:hypothetical protein
MREGLGLLHRKALFKLITEGARPARHHGSHPHGYHRTCPPHERLTAPCSRWPTHAPRDPATPLFRRSARDRCAQPFKHVAERGEQAHPRAGARQAGEAPQGGARPLPQLPARAAGCGREMDRRRRALLGLAPGCFGATAARRGRANRNETTEQHQHMDKYGTIIAPNTIRSSACCPAPSNACGPTSPNRRNAPSGSPAAPWTCMSAATWHSSGCTPTWIRPSPMNPRRSTRTATA